MKKWPADGPKLLWQYDQLGSGYSSAAIAGDRVYSAGGKDASAHVRLLAQHRPERPLHSAMRELGKM